MAFRICPLSDSAARPLAPDWAGVAHLVGALNGAPITADQLAELHAGFPADGRRHRLVALAATDQTEQVVGYANATWRSPWPKGYFYLTLTTGAAHRRQGIGSGLLAAIITWARAQGGNRIETTIDDEDTASAAFARGQGFTLNFHRLDSWLDLTTFTEGPLAGLVERVTADGLRFATYPELADQPDLDRQIYELYKVTDLDSPGYQGTDPKRYPPYKRWYAEILGNRATVREGLFLALDGDRLIGTTIVQRQPDGSLYTEYTGVLQEYRGRSIATALKLLSVRWARAAGYSVMTTRNEKSNVAMLGANRKFGYRKRKGTLWMELRV